MISSDVYDLSPKGAAIQEVILRFRLSEFATVVSFLSSHFFEVKSQGTLSSYQLFFFVYQEVDCFCYLTDAPEGAVAARATIWFIPLTYFVRAALGVRRVV